MSMKGLVEKEVSKVVTKKAVVRPEQIIDLIKKALGAPEGTAVTNVDLGNGVVGYGLEWTETPKPRAPRKAKGEPAPAAAA